MFKTNNSCRICGNTNLIEILNLGVQVLTGCFLSSRTQKVTSGPLVLVKCHSNDPKSHCGLVQLKHTYRLDELYGDNYGYRSGLNISMVKHLKNKVEKILAFVNLSPGDVIVDIGSNDATTLRFYPRGDNKLIVVDPTGNKFKEYYPEYISLIPDFFNLANIQKAIGDKKVKIITSFSMYYDLEDPVGFARDIAAVLDNDGVWVLEQSYMPEMLKQNSFDTVCHEHLEYYGLGQIKWIMGAVGLKILDVEFSNINGGSFSVVVGKKDSKIIANDEIINKVLESERKARLGTLEPYLDFAKRVEEIKKQLLKKIRSINAEGKTIYGLGASTKGNVILQHCHITETEIPFIGEVNKDKYGKYTPGTFIPVVSQEKLLAKKPDYLLVLPWHFKEFFESDVKFKNIKLIYPLIK